MITDKEILKKLEEDLEMAIERMTEDEQAELWNNYCDAMGYQDDMVWVCDSDTVDDLCYGMKPSEIIEKFGDIDFSWNYMIFTTYGAEEWMGLDSYDIDHITDYIIDLSECLDSEGIAEVLDMYDIEY